MRQLCARVKVAHRFIVSIQVVCGVLHKLPKPCHKLWLMIDINSNAPLAAVNMSLTQKPAKKKQNQTTTTTKSTKKLSINFELNCAKCVWKMCKHEAISRTKTCNTHTERLTHTRQLLQCWSLGQVARQIRLRPIWPRIVISFNCFAEICTGHKLNVSYWYGHSNCFIDVVEHKFIIYILLSALSLFFKLSFIYSDWWSP